MWRPVLHRVVENIPLPEEPPLEMDFGHIFRVKLAPITSEQVNFPVNDIVGVLQFPTLA